MAVGTTHLLPNKFYHIYNHANSDQNIFSEESNYIYFLKKYKEYISPIADTYAYCLMPNHFHFLIRIKSEETIFEFLKQNNKLPEPKMTLEEFELLFKDNDAINLFSLHISKQFSNFFNGYTQALNKQESKKGSLFLHSFKRKEIESTDYLKSLILYIHLNPVRHGFVEKITGWKYLSYHSFVSEQETMLKRKEVIGLFENVENFKFSHEQINQHVMNEIESQFN
ncbi:MAG: hypothetical protein JWP12_3140 [Bacteroidetes bacterium]|nr:hypothetical protein [Bacteroidota bacterium]